MSALSPQEIVDIVEPLVLYWRRRYGDQPALHIGRKVLVPGWTGYSAVQLQALGDKVALLASIPRVDGGA